MISSIQINLKFNGNWKIWIDKANFLRIQLREIEGDKTSERMKKLYARARRVWWHCKKQRKELQFFHKLKKSQLCVLSFWQESEARQYVWGAIAQKHCLQIGLGPILDWCQANEPAENDLHCWPEYLAVQSGKWLGQKRLYADLSCWCLGV